MSPPPLSRRKALHVIAVGATLGVAGCSSLNPLGCADRMAVVIRVESVTGPPANPLHFDDIPKAQQRFLRQAIADGEYRKCPYTEMENKEALNALALTVAERANSDEQDTAYLEYRGEHYAITMFRIEDMVAS